MTNDKKILSTLVYVCKGDNVLMMHRVKKSGDIHKDKYNGLGGKLEAGESPLDCAKREVYEEGAIKPKKIYFCGHLFFPEFDDQKRDWQVFLYRMEDFEEDIKTENHEGTLRWFSKSEVFNLNIWEGDKIFLKYVFSNKIIDGTFTYKNRQLINYQIQELSN